MKYAHVVPLALAAFCLNIATASAQTVEKPGYEAFPKGYEFPTPWTTIQEWINKGNWARIREHGWQLFIGANQPSKANPDLRVYETWYNTPETFAAASNSGTAGAPVTAQGSPHGKMKRMDAVDAVNASNPYPDNAVTNPYPINSACGFEGKRFLNNGDYMIADVYFSKEFYDHIRDNKYYDTATMNTLWGGASGAIKQFPNGTFQTKPMYWPVPKDGYAALPVLPNFNPAPDPKSPKMPVVPANPAVYNGFETWDQGVAVTVHAAGVTNKDVSYQYIDSDNNLVWKRDFKNAPVVGINDFYHVQIDQAAYDQLDNTDRCILNQSAQGIYGRDFAVGDYLITVAMHVMARENDTGVTSGLLPSPQKPAHLVNTWSLQTFWYAGGKGVSNRYTTDRPTGKGPWNNYAMCQSYDYTKPVEGDGSPHVCSNPYIEMAFPEVDRSLSSCLTCHSAGAYPSAGELTDTRPGRAHYDTPQRGAVSMDYYKNLLYTDFSWALPLSINPNVDPN